MPSSFIPGEKLLKGFSIREENSHVRPHTEAAERDHSKVFLPLLEAIVQHCIRAAEQLSDKSVMSRKRARVLAPNLRNGCALPTPDNALRAAI